MIQYTLEYIKDIFFQHKYVFFLSSMFVYDKFHRKHSEDLVAKILNLNSKHGSKPEKWALPPTTTQCSYMYNPVRGLTYMYN